MYFKPCVKYGNIIFGIYSVFIGLNVWGIHLWAQRFFRNRKRSSDEKVTTKTEKTGNWPFGQKAVVSEREWHATMPKWHCRMARSHALREWHATMPKWHSRGHSRPYCLIRVFNLISFLILTQTFHSFSSRFLSTPWTILKHKLLISKDFRESNTTKASIVGRVVFFFLIKLP